MIVGGPHESLKGSIAGLEGILQFGILTCARFLSHSVTIFRLFVVAIFDSEVGGADGARDEKGRT